VVLTSTVLPGATRYGLLPILEQRSGKKCGPDFGLCYSPEFIALGSVIRDFLNPDFTLVGEFDERSGRTLAESYAAIMANDPPCRRMSLENAELTKISVNTFVTTKIAFANMIADLCERIPGGDADVVCNALGSDARIGRKYLTGALGYGGPCFPRDNVALSYIARALGASADLAETTDRMNRAVASTVLRRLQLDVKRGSTVAILGLSYKPYSHVIEESQGVALARALADAGARVVGHDPLAGPYAAQELRDHAVILDSVADCLSQADVVVITNPDPAYRELGPNDFKNGRPSVTVVDCWRLLADKLQNTPTLRYLAVGRGVNEQESANRLRELWTLPAEPTRETTR
jgi:UDPglucose 6-dehydrogenase